MKKSDILLIVVLLCISLGFTIYNVVTPAKENPMLLIKVKDEIYGRYPLDEDTTIKINDTNICEIKDGKVSMIEANCPDKICVHSKAIDENGGSIICLPNQVYLTIESNEDDIDAFTN